MTTTYVIPALFADTAWQQLLSRGTQLVVESVFSRTINLREDRENGELYSIFLSGGYQAPHALSIESTHAPITAQRGDIISVENQSVRFSQATIVSGGCEFQDCKIQTGQPQPKNLSELKRWVQKQTNTNSFPLDTSNGEIGKTTKKLLDMRRSEYMQQACKESGDVITPASLFIGLGPGLTPSGDDYLVGQLAVAHQTKNLPHIQHAIAQAFSTYCKKTTPVSQHYLSQALRGNFSQPIQNICHAAAYGEEKTISTATKELLDHGSTSGHDALIGIIDAYDLLINKENI